jgi:hypothetical protein
MLLANAIRILVHTVRIPVYRRHFVNTLQKIYRVESPHPSGFITIVHH